MKIKSCLFAIFALGFAINAQNLPQTQVAIGSNLQKKELVYATKYDLNAVVYNTKLDSVNGCLIIETRDVNKDSTRFQSDGNMFSVDLETKKIKWSRKTNYIDATIEHLDNAIFFNYRNGTTMCIDPKTGNTRWTSDHPFFKTFPSLDIALGYKTKGMTMSLTDELECVSLKTGQTKWIKILNKDYGWNGIFIIDSTNIIVQSAGLKRIDLATGQGWNYDAVTGIRNYSHNLERNTVGMQLGMIAGVFNFAKGNNMLNQLNSNLLADSKNYYYASKEELVKLDLSGSVLWSVKLSKETSKSQIFVEGSKLYLINEGKGDYSGNEIYYGKPYFACFDANTGKSVFTTMLNTKGCQLIDSKILEEKVVLVFKDRVLECSKQDGKIIKTKKFDYKENGHLLFPVDRNRIYLSKDSNLINIDILSSSKPVYMNSRNCIVVVNPLEYNVESITEMEFVSKLSAKIANYKYTLNEDKITIINSDGKKLYRLNMGEDVFQYKNKLYEPGSCYLIEFDPQTLK